MMQFAKRLVVVSMIAAFACIAIGITWQSIDEFYLNDFTLAKKIGLLGMAIVLDFICVSLSVLSIACWWNDKF